MNIMLGRDSFTLVAHERANLIKFRYESRTKLLDIGGTLIKIARRFSESCNSRVI